jgi:hypothetical protein
MEGIQENRKERPNETETKKQTAETTQKKLDKNETGNRKRYS